MEKIIFTVDDIKKQLERMGYNWTGRWFDSNISYNAILKNEDLNSEFFMDNPVVLRCAGQDYYDVPVIDGLTFKISNRFFMRLKDNFQKSNGVSRGYKVLEDASKSWQELLMKNHPNEMKDLLVNDYKRKVESINDRKTSEEVALRLYNAEKSCAIKAMAKEAEFYSMKIDELEAGR